MEVRKITISLLVENTWNPNQMPEAEFNALIRHIREYGMRQPILVRPYGNKFEVIDGAHRLKASKEAGLSEIDAVVVELDDVQARASTIAMNQIKGEMQPLLMAQVLEEIVKGRDLKDIALMTALKEAQIKHLLANLRSPENYASLVQNPDDVLTTLTFIVNRKQYSLIQHALDKYGVSNKPLALTAICEEWLEAKFPI